MRVDIRLKLRDLVITHVAAQDRRQSSMSGKQQTSRCQVPTCWRALACGRFSQANPNSPRPRHQELRRNLSNPTRHARTELRALAGCRRPGLFYPREPRPQLAALRASIISEQLQLAWLPLWPVSPCLRKAAPSMRRSWKRCRFLFESVLFCSVFLLELAQSLVTENL